MTSNDEIFSNIEDILQTDEEQSSFDDIIRKPQKPFTHFISLGTDYREDGPALIRTLERFLKMCPMIKFTTAPELYSASEVFNLTSKQLIEKNRWFVFPEDFRREKKTQTVAFAFVSQFTSPSQVMKFLMGLIGVVRKFSDSCQMLICSSNDRYGFLADRWLDNSTYLTSSTSIEALAGHNFNTAVDERDVFPEVYNIFRVLYPNESIYDYLHELSGGYIATNMLYDKISECFEQKFGIAATVFNLPGSMSKDVNLKPLKYLRMGSEEASCVRFMAYEVTEKSKPLFFGYSTRTGDTANEDKVELADVIRDNMRHKKMNALKSRFVQTQFGVYVVMTVGVVWLESVHTHYYIMMQIKRNDDGNVADFLSRYVDY